MRYNSLIEKFKSRLIVAFIAGILFRLPFDIIISLKYNQYRLEHFVIYYSLSVFSSLVVFEVFFRFSKILNKKIRREHSLIQHFGIQMSAFILAGLIIILILRYLFDLVFLSNSFYVLHIEVIFSLVVIFIIIVYCLVEMGYFLVQNSRFSLAEMERFKKENAEFRFETLMNQLNPHFLFNSLNTLSSLVYESQDTAANYIRQLAKVYRYTLEKKQSELVKLSTDLNFVKAYIYLLELRFQDMISFNFSIGKEQENKLIAPMTIQLLIENAVKHNIVSKKKHLQIKIFTENNSLIVSNNVQLKTVKEHSLGLGLSNIKSRYSYLNTLEVEVLNNDKEFSVKIPLIDSNEHQQ